MKPIYKAGLILATIAVLCLAGFGLQRCQQHRNAKAIERPASAHADSLALQAARQQAFNERFYRLAGQVAEAHRTVTLTRRQYDSLRHLLPAALPGLPAAPARYRRP